MGNRPKRICDNCGTLFPLTREDKDHCDERCYRTAYTTTAATAQTDTTLTPP